MRRVFIAGLLLASGATGPRAQTAPGDILNPYHLNDTIVVTANRLATPSRQIASSVTVITAQQIEQTGTSTVAEVLRTVPGLDVVQSGGPGQQTSVFLRGANSEHVLVIVDGVEINDPASPNNAVNLATLGTDDIERVEILRGPQSVLYGSDAVGGVIQIFTRRGLGERQVQLSAEAGSFDSYREQLSVAEGRDEFDYSLVVSRRDIGGISASSGAENLESDGLKNTAVSGGIALRPLSRFQVRLAGRISDSDTDLDQGGGVLDDPNYTMNSKDRFVSARLEHDVISNHWWQQFGAYVTRYKRSTLDGIDAAHPMDTNKTEYAGRRIKYDWQSAIALNDISRFTFGAETEEDRLSQALYFGSAWGDYTARIDDVAARTTGVYALGELSFKRQWYATAGLRYDHHDAFGDYGTYRITTVWMLDRIGLKLRATFGTGFKAPALFQIFDPSTGNPSLRPERSRGGEIGFEESLSGSRLSFGVTYFHTDFDNLIQYRMIDPVNYIGYMVNVAEARTRGTEAFVSYSIASTSIRIDHTYTDADDRQSGQALLRRPRHKASFQAERNITKSLDMRVEINYTGARYDTDYSGIEVRRATLHDYAVMNVAGIFKLNSNVRLSGRLGNVLDAKYEEAVHFSSVPRSAALGVHVVF